MKRLCERGSVSSAEMETVWRVLRRRSSVICCAVLSRGSRRKLLDALLAFGPGAGCLRIFSSGINVASRKGSFIVPCSAAHKQQETFVCVRIGTSPRGRRFRLTHQPLSDTWVGG